MSTLTRPIKPTLPLYSEKFPLFNPKIQSYPMESNFKIKKRLTKLRYTLHSYHTKKPVQPKALNNEISYKPLREKKQQQCNNIFC